MLTKDMLIRLDRAKQQLAEIGEPSLSLSKIAQEANLSPSHFIRRFTAAFGETPHQFRIRTRLERAKEMLVLGEGSVTDVCMSVGFSSLGSFSWLFSQRFGESPSGYRKRLLPSLEIPGRLPPHLVPGCVPLMVSAWRTPQFSRSAPATRLAESGSLAFGEGVKVRIKLNSIFVDDQSKAFEFYTKILGFIPSQDVPVGEFRWLTVRSPEGGECELSLEPNANPAARAYQEALFKQRIPLTAFEVDNIESEFQHLRAKGVEFTTEPMQAGPVWMAVFSDTCGNLIQIYQPPRG